MAKKTNIITGRTASFIGLLLLVPSLLLNAYFIYQSKRGGAGYKAAPGNAGYKAAPGNKVVKVIDGDTFEIEGEQRVRLRQLDAPDMGLCGSEKAKEFLTSLIENKYVRLEEKVIGQQNRPLALAYVGNTFVNLELLKNGWGRYHHDTTSQKEALQEAGNKAKSERIGIYDQKCYGTEPDNPKCLIKGNIDKTTDTRIYYYPGCPQYNFTIVEKDIGEQWFCTTKEAEAAEFIRAKNCPEYNGEYK